MLTVFALTLIFADGYLGGSTHAADFKDLATCNRNGSQLALQFVHEGHPASFICNKTQAQKRSSKQVERIEMHFPSMIDTSPNPSSTVP